VSVWQLIAGIDQAALVRERPQSKPHASIVLRQSLADGSEAEAIGLGYQNHNEPSS
jgi:hypothetical protein